MITPCEGVKTWTQRVEAHRARLLTFRAKLQRFKAMDSTTRVLADTATALNSAAAGVEEWSTSRSTNRLIAAAKELASLQVRQDEAKESLRNAKCGSKLAANPKMNGKQIVDLSLFTRARWEAERRKGEAMLAGDGEDCVKIWDKEMPKPAREEKACNQVRGRHVLVTNSEKAKRIYIEMSVTGTADRQGFLRNANSGRFASLATERSECTGTARQGGDLGWLSKDNNPSKLQEVAFVTPRNACSPPFRSGSGFHLFYCEERR